MLTTLIHKELRAVALSPKFTATLAVCTVLLLLSVYIGVQEYNNAVDQYATATRLVDEQMEQSSNWHSISDRVFREPDPMTIFSSGVTYDIGRWTDVDSRSTIQLRNGVYSDDPIFAVFRFLDFTFIVTVVFSLFAILFTFDAVNGEREQGTLRLVLSNSVSRAKYILAKCIGSWLGLVVPITIPILLSLLLVVLLGVPLSGVQWTKILLLSGMSLLYITLFIVFGVLMSTLTRESSVSFLVALVSWVAMVLIVPSAGILAAGQLVEVRGAAEIDGQRDAYAKDLWAVYYAEAEERILQRESERGDGEGVSDDELWQQMIFEDSVRKEVQREIDAYEAKLDLDLRNSEIVRQRLGLTLSRLSPASAFQLACMNLAGSNLALKSQYESALARYRTEFNTYVDRKRSESGSVGGMVIRFDSEEGMSIGSNRDDDRLDLSDRPHFVHADVRLASVVEDILPDFGLLSLLVILGFAGAFVGFLRYDVR